MKITVDEKLVTFLKVKDPHQNLGIPTLVENFCPTVNCLCLLLLLWPKLTTAVWKFKFLSFVRVTDCIFFLNEVMIHTHKFENSLQEMLYSRKETYIQH